MSKRSLKNYFLNNKVQPDLATRRKNAERELINAESALGRTLFGEVAKNHKREFFCLERNVWIWYENGQTIRYEVRKNGIWKKIDDGDYHLIRGEELRNFTAATKAYLELVKAQLYR